MRIRTFVGRVAAFFSGLVMLGASASLAAEKAIYAQAGSLYPSFAEGYGLTKYVEALEGLFKIHPELKGKVEFKVFDKATLYPTQDAHVEAVSTGAIQMSYCAPHFLEALEPAFKVGTTPGLFDDFGHFKRAMQTPAWKKVHDNLAKDKGLTVLEWLFDAGELYIFSSTPVTTFDDLKGRKIRYPGGEGWRLALASLGANPISIPYTEVVTSLQTNLISGLITDFTGGVGYYELNKFTPYAVIVPVTIQPICFMVNTDWWQGLGEKRRAAIRGTFDILDASAFYSGLTEGKIAVWENSPDQHVVRPANAGQWKEIMRSGAADLVKDLDPVLLSAIADSR